MRPAPFISEAVMAKKTKKTAKKTTKKKGKGGTGMC
jgi:hypothetical protein